MTTAGQGIRCAIYTRKSSDEGLDQTFNSLDAQFEACAAFVASQKHEGWKLAAGRYDDGGLSGGTLERPALKRLLADIAIGKIDMIVVYKIDRLTRSLADFARLVEQLEAKGCSFVSVTQAFNTSTSMGRLTLNVLLSFAQFEREVTAERIRDKISASKKKGLWMGGIVPLGYSRHPDPLCRELILDAEGAQVVHRLFELYRELGSLRDVEIACKTEGLTSKRHVFASGREQGGGNLSRGQIHHVLTNPIYLGRVRHKEVSYVAAHPPIISEVLWQEVQSLLQESASKPRGRRRVTAPSSGASLVPSAKLLGKVRDEIGDLMTPTHAQRHGRVYRYYISNRLVSSGPDRTAWRVPAKTLEMAVQSAIACHFESAVRGHRVLAVPDAGLSKSVLETAGARITTGRATPDGALLALVKTVRLSRGLMTIELDERAVADLFGIDSPQLDGTILCFNTEFQLRRRGIETKLVSGSFANAPDETLRSTLARAHRWTARLRVGTGVLEIARDEGHAESYLRTRGPFAFLSPKIQEAILNGSHPADLTTERIARTGIPLDWAEQERLFGFA